MPIHRGIRLVPLLAPLLLFGLLAPLLQYSDMLSLTLHGHPFAQVVAKEKLNVFDFVPMDCMRSKALVFSHGRLIGWIYQPVVGLAGFVPFSATPNFDVTGFDWWLDFGLLVACCWRWYLLPLQAIVLLLWIRSRASGSVAR